MTMSLEQIKERLNDDPAEALQWILQNGRLYGNEFCCGDVTGTAARKGNKGSFLFNIRRLVGNDFSNGDRGYHGVYDVFVAHVHGDQSKAIGLARQFLGIPSEQRPAVVRGHERGSKGKENDKYEVLKVFENCPETSPVIPERHRHCLSKTWQFARLNGTIAGYSYRIEFNQADGTRKKLVLPLTWCLVRNKETGDTRECWFSAGLPAPQPLMDVAAVAAAQSVILLEGEKTRDAGELQRLSGNHPFSQFDASSSWHGGTNRLEKIDWSVLHGKDVMYWPDADNKDKLTDIRPGFRAGERLPRIMAQQGVVPASYKLATPHTDLGGGWDPADPLPAQLGLEWIDQKLRTAEVYVSP